MSPSAFLLLPDRLFHFRAPQGTGPSGGERKKKTTAAPSVRIAMSAKAGFRRQPGRGTPQRDATAPHVAGGTRGSEEAKRNRTAARTERFAV